MLTCETELVEIIFPRNRTVRDAIYERAKDRTSSGFVDAEDVGAASSGSGGVVRVRLGEGRRWRGGDVHLDWSAASASAAARKVEI